MKEFVIGANDAGQRLDRFVSKVTPSLPPSLTQKYIRLKRIKVNGARGTPSGKLAFGDVVQMYVNDEFFSPKRSDSLYTRLTPRLSIVYEDDNILLADKRPGMLSHSDEAGGEPALIDHIQAYLYKNGEWHPEDENSFAPALANRIDRNTGGIVIAAKNAEALRVLNEKIKVREIKKYYLCLIEGQIDPPSGRLDSFIFKDAKKNRVYVRSTWSPGAKAATTLYRTVDAHRGVSLVECELVTGRTHQIRAHFASAGHPLIGDGKYGKTSDKDSPLSHQALYSYKLRFAFEGAPNALSYLNGKTFEVANVPLRAQFDKMQ